MYSSSERDLGRTAGIVRLTPRLWHRHRGATRRGAAAVAHVLLLSCLACRGAGDSQLLPNDTPDGVSAERVREREEQDRPIEEHEGDLSELGSRDASTPLDESVWTASSRMAGRERWKGRISVRWMHVGSLDDETLLTPASVEVVPSGIVISDLGAGRIVAYDRIHGAVRWRAGREGSGPNEFRRPFVARDSDTSIVVVDIPLRRLQVLTSDGSFGESRSLAAFGSVSGACRHPDGSAWWIKLTPSGQVELNGVGLLRDGADSLDALQPLPVEVPMHPSGIGSTASLVRSKNGDCYVAPTHFAWVGLVSSSGSILKYPLVEDVAAPVVVVEPQGANARRITLSSESVSITRALSISENRAYVIARGASDARGRIVDIYRLAPWGYEGSIVFPEQVLSVSVADSTLAAITEDSTGYLRVLVATITPPAP